MTLVQPQPIDHYKRQQLVFTILGAVIAGSLVFWPLITSWFSIALFGYWLVAATKDFSAGNHKRSFIILFASLYVLAIIGTLYSANMDEALFKLQQKSAIAMFPLVFGTAVAVNAAVCHRIFLAFAWCTLAGCLICLGNGLIYFFQSGSAEMLHGYPMVILKDMSPFMLGLYCLLSILYLLGAVYKGTFKRGRERSLYIAVLLTLSLFLFLLGNRNVLFSWMVVAVFFLLANIVGRKLRILFFGLLLAALAGAAVFNPSFHRQLNDLTDFSANNTIQLDSDKSLGRGWGGKALRFAIWNCSMDIVREHPLTGVGTGDVQDSLQAAYDRRQFYFASRYNTYNAHNQFIQETLSYGIAGFMVFSACLLIPLFAYFRSLRGSGAASGRQLYCLFLVSFFIICITESILEISKGIVFYSFFNSIFAFVLTQPTTKSSTDLYGTKAS
ncbi:MAG TPA: O-antigen ligase family protein [Chitinophagaceae bacterium]|nr:O-antigen ligase family protein [Chitinophagaceae bacterium]